MFCSPDIFFHSWNNVKSDCLVTDNLLHPTIFLYQSSECIDRIHLLSQICQKRYLTLTPVSSRTSLAAQSVKLSSSLIFPFGNPQHFFLPDMENHKKSTIKKVRKLPKQLLTRRTFVKLELRITAPNIGMDSL